MPSQLLNSLWNSSFHNFPWEEEMMFGTFFSEICWWYPACFPSPNSALLVRMMPCAALWPMLLFLSVLSLQRGGGCWGHHGLPQGSEGPQAGQSTGQELLSLRSSKNSVSYTHSVLGVTSGQSPSPGSLSAKMSQIFHVRTWHLFLTTCSPPWHGCKGDVTPVRSSCHLPLWQTFQTVGSSSFVGFLILKLHGKGFTSVNRHIPEYRCPFIPFFHIFRHNRNLQNCFKFCQRHIALGPAPFPLFWDSLHYNMGHTRSFPTYLLFLKSWPWFAIDSKYCWHSVNLAFEIKLNYRVTKYSLFSENLDPCANSGVYSSRLSYVCWHLS